MSLIVITALLLALIIYTSIGLIVGRRTKDVADLLPMAKDRHAIVENPVEFSTGTVAPTISLATVIMAFFELAQSLGLWLVWTAVTTAAGLFVVRLLAGRIWERMSTYEYRPTLHEFLGREFNSQVLLYVGAIFTSLGFLGALAVELMVGTKFFAGLIPEVPSWIVIIVLCVVSFFYTAVGGFRAVIVSDRIQMIAIWMLLLCLPAFYVYYVITHGGWNANFNKIPQGIMDFKYSDEIFSFLLGIFVMNVPTFISDMSIWQRIAGTPKNQTVIAGLNRSIFSSAATWGILALLACFAFMIVSPMQGVNPLVSLIKIIGVSGGVFPSVVLFVVVIGLYGAMLATASTQLIAVSHTLYTDVFIHYRKRSLQDSFKAQKELNVSRAILVLAAIISTIIVQLLTGVGFSIADLVFAIYGAQLGLCPLVLVALIFDRKLLKNLYIWAATAVCAGFIAGWSAAIFGRLVHNTDLVFLSPVFSLVTSLLILGLGIICVKAGQAITAGVNWILIKSIIKARQNGLYRLTLDTKPTRLVCLMDKCAKCCSVIGTPVVTPREAEIIGLDLLMKDSGAMFIKSDDCVCTLLKKGLCSIYPRRPKGCREYPWYNIGGKLYYDAGCPGVKYDIDERPDVEDIQPFENFFPHTPRFVVWLIKRICVRS